MAKATNSKRASLILPLALAALGAQSATAGDCFGVLNEDRNQDYLFELCEAAQAGNPGAMYWLGLAYIEGEVLNDYDEGLAWLKKASRAGNAEAQRLYEFIDNAQIGPGC